MRGNDQIRFPVSEFTFLCYARQDADFVLPVARDLQRRGVTLWVDQFDIEPGDDWDRAIDTSLHACARVLIVLSPAAVASNEVRGELRIALNDRKPVVPLLYRPCDIPRQLQNIQIVDFSRTTAADDGALDESRPRAPRAAGASAGAQSSLAAAGSKSAQPPG